MRELSLGVVHAAATAVNGRRLHPGVDARYDFGRISGDVYVIGRTPLCAFNVVAFPLELHSND